MCPLCAQNEEHTARDCPDIRRLLVQESHHFYEFIATKRESLNFPGLVRI